jgi:ABC-type multidrug transport system fused ATPase/permease subunit
MFGGTLRTNLDPFHEHDDKELFEVLRKCLLGHMVDGNEEGLDAKVEVMGSNYSLGTQQLICLARAMLNPSRILLWTKPPLLWTRTRTLQCSKC